MSEYQYYEFAAVDGPISDEGLRYARVCSSRAEVSRFRWQNTYNFGGFHGSVDALLKYYDAHFYTANWGTVRLGLAFPKGCLTPEAIQPYLRGGERHEDTLTAREVGNRRMVWWERNEEGGWGWTEGEGGIDQLIGIREELMRGDYRALFLGWLADFDPDEWRDPKNRGVLVPPIVPPIPAGLDRLSPTLAALIEQFPVDRDALFVAAGQSHALPVGERAGASAVALPSLASFLPTPSTPEDDNRSPTVTYAEVLPEEPGKEKLEFESGFNKPTVNGQWQKCVGRCFARRNGQWVQAWQTEPLDVLFQPLPLAWDFDGDAYGRCGWRRSG